MPDSIYTVSEDGRISTPKDPDARNLRGVDLSNECAALGASLVSVQALPSGVTVDGTPIVQGNTCAAWVTGGDAAADENKVTFRYTLSDTTVDDLTIYFKIKER